MKQIVNFRHAEGKDFGTFEKDGKPASFDNVAIMTIDAADTEWHGGKPQIDKVPYELLLKAQPKLTSSSLPDLIGKFIILEKEAKVYQGKLSEKVTGVYLFD